MVISKGLKQAYDMQDFAYETSMAVRESLKSALGKICPPDKDKAAIIAQLGKVWKDAQEQVRIHRGKPLPGSLTHEKVKRGSVGKQAKWATMMHTAGLPAEPGEQPDQELEQAEQPTPEQPPSNLPT